MGVLTNQWDAIKLKGNEGKLIEYKLKDLKRGTI